MVNRLMQNGEQIVRVLDGKGDLLLIVDCVRQAMPKWVQQSELSTWQAYQNEELEVHFLPYDELDKESKRFVHEHYTLIAGVLPFAGEKKQRQRMIACIAEQRGVSKQTIRHYLWRYLAYQDIAALAPKQKKQDKSLTQDEKNMRWALNKFFYTRHKNSLTTAYTLMLKEKYCDSTGVLLPDYPTIHQFRYFYRKYNKMQTYYISRDGIKSYQRNHRPLLGDGVREFAPAVGVGMLDSTICDIYLVDDSGSLVGRPILTACVDAYSGMCCGYSLSWEGGVYSLRNLMGNVIADKVDWCSQFGISINREDWNCDQLPATLVTDKGSEYKSGTFEQIAELGVTVINLPPFRPELKGSVEKFFDVVQASYKKHLKGKGVIEPDFQERGVRDYRKDACLTMEAFEQILLHCIIYYNCKRIIEDFPFTGEMLAQPVTPRANSIWNWSKERAGANLISCTQRDLTMTLLPRTTGKFSRHGLKVNQLRYKNEAFTEQYLSGGTAVVAYDPDDISRVWLIEKSVYTEFSLVESRFSGLAMEDMECLKNTQRSLENRLKADCLQAQIDLASHIEAITQAAPKCGEPNITQIRQTRKKEQEKAHTGGMPRE